MGIPITYRRLTVYRGRLQREKEKAARGMSRGKTVVAPVGAATERGSDGASTTFDPFWNLREREKKRVTWQYPTGPPDESKLF